MTVTITLSVEVELGWGGHDTGAFGKLSSGGTTERQYLTALLRECERLSIPLSFDIVGHLFLAACSGTHDGPHPAGWFDADPGTDYRTDPLFYAPDVVAYIRAHEVSHELCTHSFSHALFSDAGRDVCAWELRRAQELHSTHAGGPADSLVPPRHQSPEYDLLHAHDVDCLRPAMPSEQASDLRRYKQLLAGPLPLSTLRSRDGVVETYCTTYPSLTAPSLPAGQRATHPAFRPLPERVRRRLHLRKLRQATLRAVRQAGHLHLWCHLADLSNESQWQTVREYLRWLARERERENISIVPMAELPAQLRNHRRSQCGLADP